MDQRKIKLGPQHLHGQVRAESFNEEDRTVEVVWTTGARVKRYSWTGEYFEELSLKKDHVKLERLNAGAPVLNNHSSYDLRSSIGVVEKAWIKDKKGYAIIRLSGRDDVKGIVQDIKEGIIRNISVGYRVDQFEDVSKKKDETPTFRAIDWTPMELSFVNIPADKDAQVRTESETYEAIILRQEDIMPKENDATLETKETKTPEVKNEQRSTESDSQSETQVDLKKVETEAETRGQEKEMERQEAIRSIVRSVGLEDSIADDLIKNKKTKEEANADIVRMLAEKNSEKKTTQTNVEVNDVDNKGMRRKAATNAIEHLYGPAGHRPELIDGARDFCGDNIIDVARKFMRSEGIDVENLRRDEIAKLAIGGVIPQFGRSHTSSDFPFIVADVTNKTLQREYQEKPQTFAPFVSERSPVSDFKTLQSTKFGDAPVFEEVDEKGEYKKGSISEGKEEYKIKKYGKLIEVSEELLMNDDLGAMLALAGKFGRRARELESDIVWGIINANAAMGDGQNLFSAPHGNLAGAGATISVTTVGAARQAMRLQKGLDGAKIEIRPSYLVVPAALETVAEQFLGATAPLEDGKVNPFKSLRLISEVRLDDVSATAWYIFGDSGQSEMIETVKMRGYEQPEISTKMAFESDCMKMKVKYYFAAKALDWVGFYKNPGA